MILEGIEIGQAHAHLYLYIIYVKAGAMCKKVLFWMNLGYNWVTFQVTDNKDSTNENNIMTLRQL